MTERRADPVGDHRDRSPLKGIGLKVLSVAIFVGMSSLIKSAGQLPPGQIVFYRSFFAILPLLVMLGWQGALRSGLRTNRLGGHIARGTLGVVAMGMSFFALTRLPLPEAITLNYAQPLLLVVFSVLFLGETIRIYRWTAVVVGLVGVLIVSWPKLTLLQSPEGIGSGEAAGVIAAIAGAAVSAGAMLMVRSLVRTENSATIVLWFSITASVAGLCSAPFGWSSLSMTQMALLVSAGIVGGIAQVLMTEAYRYAEASTVAPFEYASLLLAIVVGYVVFSEVPTAYTLVGGAIVTGAGLFIIWRERRLGIVRPGARKLHPPQ